MTLLLPLALIACSGTSKVPGDSADTSGDGASSIDGPPLVINEFLAMNDTTNADNAGEYDDWVELYNTSDTIVQFDGLYLTDNKDQHTKWALPTGQGIDGHGYVLFWCDDDDGLGTDSGSHVSQGDDHTSFQLNGKGETLMLYYVQDGKEGRVDAIDFGAQQPDISGARVPDGSLNWTYGTPTPDASNGA